MMKTGESESTWSIQVKKNKQKPETNKLQYSDFSVIITSIEMLDKMTCSTFNAAVAEIIKYNVRLFNNSTVAS